MARVTQEEVAGIIKVNLTKIPDLTPFIDAANLLVTDECAGSSYSDARLKQIELWLSAHFYAVRDPRRSSEAASGVSQSLQSSVSLGFNVTHYGQQAMLLDTVGNLSRLQGQLDRGRGRITAGVIWAGTASATEGGDA